MVFHHNSINCMIIVISIKYFYHKKFHVNFQFGDKRPSSTARSNQKEMLTLILPMFPSVPRNSGKLHTVRGMWALIPTYLTKKSNSMSKVSCLYF